MEDAMLAAIGMIGQELATGSTLCYKAKLNDNGAWFLIPSLLYEVKLTKDMIWYYFQIYTSLSTVTSSFRSCFLSLWIISDARTKPCFQKVAIAICDFQVLGQ
jgi:hypothetical protein